MHVATRECIAAWDVTCITSVALRGQSIQCNASQSFPTNIFFSEMYVGNAHFDEMQDYESEEVDDQMDEDTPFNGMSGSGMHYSEEGGVRYTRNLEKSVSSLPQVVTETCKQTETHVCTLEWRVDALHFTMQQSVSMCSENCQRVQKNSARV